jgi:hypothetical protein
MIKIDVEEQTRHLRGSVNTYAVTDVIDIKDDLFNDFPAQTAALISDINEYWKNNVEKYFSKSLNYPTRVNLLQLRDACRIETVKKGGTSNGMLVVELAPMWNRGFEYGKVIINGRQPSEHYLYIPELGASIDVDKVSFEENTKVLYNQHRKTKGTDNRAWLAWKTEFNTYVRNRMIGFVRQCIKAGLVRRKKR